MSRALLPLVTLVMALMAFGVSGPALARQDTVDGKPGSDEMVWGLAWNVAFAVLADARGAAPDAVKGSRDGAELLARYLSVPLPPFPARGSDSDKDLVVAAEYIVGSGGKAIAASLRERYDDRHVALFDVGMRLPLLSVLYAPKDSTGRATRLSIARAASAAALPAELFQALFDKVDRGASGREVTAEVIALRASVLAHLRSH